MTLTEIEATLSPLSDEQREVLEDTYTRYLCFVGVTSVGPESDEQAQADRATYPDLLETVDGVPCVSSDAAADFMTAVSGLPRHWCAAWEEHEFYTLHGLTLDDAARLYPDGSSLPFAWELGPDPAAEAIA